MARVRKVELTSEEIKAQITSIEEQITKLTEDIKGLRVQKKNLSKDLVAAEKKEAAVKKNSLWKILPNYFEKKDFL